MIAALRHFWTGTRIPPAKYFDPWNFMRVYRKAHFTFSRLRHLRYGSHIARLNERPCPICHGNDQVSNIREGFCCLLIHCDRCEKDYWA